MKIFKLKYLKLSILIASALTSRSLTAEEKNLYEESSCALETFYSNPGSQESGIEELAEEFFLEGSNSSEEFSDELDSCIDSGVLEDADDYLGGYLDLADLYEEYKASKVASFPLFLAGPPERIRPGRTNRHLLPITRPRVRVRTRPAVRPGLQHESPMMRRSRLSLCLKQASDRLIACQPRLSGDCIVRYILDVAACYGRRASN